MHLTDTERRFSIENVSLKDWENISYRKYISQRMREKISIENIESIVYRKCIFQILRENFL